MKDCDMIKELLPMYIEGDCSDKIKAIIEMHLDTCSECQKEYEGMIAPITPMPIVLPEAEQINPFKKIKKRNKRNIMLILSLAILIIAVIVFLAIYLDFKNGRTIYCQRSPVVVFEAIIDSFSYSDNKSKISIVLAEKEGNIYDYNNHSVEIYDVNKNQYYHVNGETIATFDSICVKIVPQSKKEAVSDSFDLLTVVNIIKAVLAEEDMNESKMAITINSYNGVITSNMNFYYDAINNTFVNADEFTNNQDGHKICIIQLTEPKVEAPKNGVLMGKDIKIIKIAIFY